MNEKRDYRKLSDRNYYPKMDKRKKHEEVKQIKEDLINYAKTSWGKKWIHSILKIGRPYRMRRAMKYAEDEERISNLVIKKGEIFSLVQGTAPTPYRVRIFFKPIPEKAWQEIEKEISKNLLNLIHLLEGNLSDEIIEIFEKKNYSLFYDISEGFNARCSCPDQAIPCKHIAATILYVSRVVDYNPLILLKLKGKKKKELLSELNIGRNIAIEPADKASNKQMISKKTSYYSFNVPKISTKEIKIQKSLRDDIKDINFQFSKPGKVIETLENLGLPPNLENPRAFAIVLDKIYRTITTEAYKISLSK